MTRPVPSPPRARLLGIVACFAALSVASAAGAAISCTISAATLSFGAYDPIAKAEVDSTAPLTMTCTGSGTVSATMSMSPGQSGDQENRYMSSGSNHLLYGLYLGTQRQVILGDGTGNTRTRSISFSSPGSNTSNAFGAILSGQNPKAGSYSDTITVSVSY